MDILDIARKFLQQTKGIDSQSLSTPSVPLAFSTDCAKSAESAVSPPTEPSPIPPARYPSADPVKWGLPPGTWLAADVDPLALTSPFLPENADLLRALDEMETARKKTPPPKRVRRLRV